MQICIEDRLNVVISGGTSTGKATFARALLEMVGTRERLVTIEDAFVLFPAYANTVSMKSDRVPGSEIPCYVAGSEPADAARPDHPR
ncbi:Type II/IV secretion system protein [Alloyangia pacifica]|uniref:Type II/IV secretion system protein n=2 Tax=Alloyangia pacifica TaxID=311180 RepID=A0A1I6WJN5_9RHOB|nr:Type II/IV secretion system protein [Alloyangia pacifica]SFT26193.1 Type II/IV secretion system protein [Alloyangia pacifica]